MTEENDKKEKEEWEKEYRKRCEEGKRCANENMPLHQFFFGKIYGLGTNGII